MAVKEFCGAENQRFPSEEFVDTAQGRIHVIEDDQGHTAEGWPATYRLEGTRYSDYKVYDVVVAEVEIPDYDALDFNDEA